MKFDIAHIHTFFGVTPQIPDLTVASSVTPPMQVSADCSPMVMLQTRNTNS